MFCFFLYTPSTRHVSLFFFSSRRRHTRSTRDWSSDVCSSDLVAGQGQRVRVAGGHGRGGLLPPLAIGTCLGQRRRGRACRGVGQRGGGPVIRDRVRAGHVVPERQAGSATRRGERLTDRRVTTGRTRRRPKLRGVRTRVRTARRDRRGTSRRPARKAAGFEVPVGDAYCGDSGSSGGEYHRGDGSRRDGDPTQGFSHLVDSLSGYGARGAVIIMMAAT